MLILGIETSCDETSAAVLRKDKEGVRLLSNVVSSSAKLHSQTGGIIPEVAAREQIKLIIPAIREALSQASLDFYEPEISAVAVTIGPGLIGSLLVGVETAKTLSLAWNKPLIPVNHLYGHLYANFIDQKESIRLPSIGLIVSGGHTDLVMIEKHGKIKWLGGTRDDAAGEAFDKIGRMLGLPYPSGPTIERLAKNGISGKFKFPRPLAGSSDFDFSFSGLKTAVYREIKNKKLSKQDISDICLEIQNAIVDVLVKKTLHAAEKHNAGSILLGGGVAANGSLCHSLMLKAKSQNLNAEIFVPQKSLCTDNGAMIAAAAFFHNKIRSMEKIDANPSLHL